ncbi:MAG: hypothetical protein H0U64_08155 [Gemmatimonadaceae bacterium]|nr:hypothetical protein [Gemmatimonadaceae bacterium]
MRFLRVGSVLTALAGLATAASAQLNTPLDSSALAAFRWRQIGPAVMSGRITDIEAVVSNPRIFYVVAATGGVWKTINNGTTFFPIFDRERIISLGDLAIAPSNPDILYLGTGEEDSRNSISPGGGVYKSTDAGRTWKLVGLEATQHIGRIVVHPTDPNTVYVAALGKAWGRNPERGLYKSTDGGATWKLSKFVSNQAGFVDLVMDPSNPDILYASSWNRIRTPYDLTSGGPGSGLWKTTDAGTTWTEITGAGFPATMKGRIGIAISQSNPRVVYTWVEADTLPNSVKKGQKPDTAKAQRLNSGIYRSMDAGVTWTLMRRNEQSNARQNYSEARPFYYSQIRVDPRNPERIYWMSSVFHFSDDGGKTDRRGALSLHTDWHAMWINPNDPDHFILGEDGGVGITWDKGGTYNFPALMPLGQFYAVNFDMQKLYRVCGGLQDNGTWCGPSRTRNALGILNSDWVNVGGGDGFYTAIDPNDPNIIYTESQGGNASRLDIVNGTRTPIMRGNALAGNFEDSLIVARGDTTLPVSPQITRALQDLRRRAAADTARRYRFNWSAPFFLSTFAPTTIYMAGNQVLKSVDRGDHFYPISPDLSAKDSVRLKASTELTGGITRDATGAETHGTITTIAESPIRPGILWAGTDDGNVWVTANDGASWANITGRFPGVPAKTWVSRVEPSHFDTATVYVTFDGHRNDDFRPHVFISNDFGRTFRSVSANLPSGGSDFVQVIREDLVNRDLLFVGTDVGLYVSTNRGGSWQKFMNGMPTVPVHDLKIHPRERELIAGTHGRSIFVTDIAPLQEMRDSNMSGSHFFTPKTAYQYTTTRGQGWYGNHNFTADNPPYGATIVYRLTGGERRDSAKIVITNIAGDVVRSMNGPGGPGTHRVTWDLRSNPRPLSPSQRRDSLTAARVRSQRQDSIARAGGDTSAAGRNRPDTTGMGALRDSMTARTARGDTAGARVLRDSVASRMRAAGGGRFGGGGRGSAGGFGTAGSDQPNLRPAEAPVAPAAGAGGAGAFGAGGGGRGGLGAGRTGPAVEAGDYLVTITVGGQTLRRAVRVERIGEIREDPGFFGNDEDAGGEDGDFER